MGATAATEPQGLVTVLPTIYVLSVRHFHDRINHVQQILGRCGLAFEFIFEHDPETLTPEVLDSTFEPNVLSVAHRSLVLKHIHAWRQGVAQGLAHVLVFEDDVILSADFNQRMAGVLAYLPCLAPGHHVFLGGINAKVPESYLMSREPVVPMGVASATAEGYLTDCLGLQRRLAWLETHLVALPADHLIQHIDQAVGNDTYWSKPALVCQGSVTGLFDSHLDSHRKKHSWLFNVARYYWTILFRHHIRKWLAQLKQCFKSK